MRYGDGYDNRYTSGGIGIDLPLDPSEFIDRITQNAPSDSQIDQVSPAQITADQNNYSLPNTMIIRLSTDALRTITGFAGARPGISIIVNVGTQDLVIANSSASSTAENRVLCHTGANITLNANESVQIFYDFSTLRWRTVGFV